METKWRVAESKIVFCIHHDTGSLCILVYSCFLQRVTEESSFLLTTEIEFRMYKLFIYYFFFSKYFLRFLCSYLMG